MPQFTSKDEEVSYWKERADDTERELEEFRENSLMLEKELEGSLEQADKTIRDLRTRNNRLQLENDTIRDKFEEYQQESIAQIGELQGESDQYRKREENYVKYIRELEQKNDDLERAQRVMYVSLGEFETKLNSAIERNVLLEHELDEKEMLKTSVQRLMDEARDLKQEIQCREKARSSMDNDKASLRIMDLNKMAAVRGADEPPATPPPLKTLTQSTGTGTGGITHIGMTPPTRISAMNIVGDLLRKVGALETKLASCRNSPRDCLTPGDTYRGRQRLNRGTSSPSIHNLVRS